VLSGALGFKDEDKKQRRQQEPTDIEHLCRFVRQRIFHRSHFATIIALKNANGNRKSRHQDKETSTPVSRWILIEVSLQGINDHQAKMVKGGGKSPSFPLRSISSQHFARLRDV